ncbi:MAG: hypothetical protein QNK20_01095 [Aureibaculum sp.]|nr:hypothetical protein [Aureibaculum sp.]
MRNGILDQKTGIFTFENHNYKFECHTSACMDSTNKILRKIIDNLERILQTGKYVSKNAGELELFTK